MSYNKFDFLFDPDLPEVKIVQTFFHELDNVKENPNDMEELQQAFWHAAKEHSRRLSQIEEETGVIILE